MMTLEQIRQRNKAENAAAQRLQAAGLSFANALHCSTKLSSGKYFLLVQAVK